MGQSSKSVSTPPIPVVWGYGLSLLSVGLAAVASYATVYFRFPLPFTALALCAISLTFWYGGVRAGILAAIFSAILRFFFFESGLPVISRVIYDLVFLIFAVLMTRATQARDRLEATVAERTAALSNANENLREEIREREKSEVKLLRSEFYLAEAQQLSRTGSFGWNVSSNEIYWSPETFRIFECDPKEKITFEMILERTHPEDRAAVQQFVERVTQQRSAFDFEHRLLMPDGSVKHIHIVGRPFENESGPVEFVGAVSDISERKRAEEALRRSERYLTEAQRMTRSGCWAWDPHTEEIYWSKEMFRIFDYPPETTPLTSATLLDRVHPEDRSVVRQRAVEGTSADRVKEFGGDYRIVLPDGTVKYLHSMGYPVVSESGETTEVIGITMDVSEQHAAKTALETAFKEIEKLKDQLYKENIALREEIDRSSMFEEIVGESPAVRTLLARVTKVAPTDSTVLVTGETGTGKELVARAIHRRSSRSDRAFVSVNCAAIPQSLISSELFGHEKGAFTGAIQRRLGRFELAEGGTIFLDEVGEFPPDTQISLLRVLQEREFERVGGNRVIRADVRVIAATNRDLLAAVEAGTFRADLYYRLNVFPIDVPPLRNRVEDIQILVEYFIDRYASKAGKTIRRMNRDTLERLQSYAWPGNIRELQNIIERSVIVCESETFAVDESWLSQPKEMKQSVALPFRMSPSEEKATIEAALAETRGRVSGASGAAAKLGIPASTLDSKIKSLKINKHRFKT